MSWVDHLPACNAVLNSLSAVFLVCGYWQIRHQNVRRHRLCMLSAFGVSSLFLVGYIVFHALRGVVRFQGQGWVREVYFTILISHSILAVVIVPLVLRTLYLALAGRFLDHQLWARWTLPVWFYVSVTGVVIYEMLY